MGGTYRRRVECCRRWIRLSTCSCQPLQASVQGIFHPFSICWAGHKVQVTPQWQGDIRKQYFPKETGQRKTRGRHGRPKHIPGQAYTADIVLLSPVAARPEHQSLWHFISEKMNKNCLPDHYLSRETIKRGLFSLLSAFPCHPARQFWPWLGCLGCFCSALKLSLLTGVSVIPPSHVPWSGEWTSHWKYRKMRFVLFHIIRGPMKELQGNFLQGHVAMGHGWWL